RQKKTSRRTPAPSLTRYWHMKSVIHGLGLVAFLPRLSFAAVALRLNCNAVAPLGFTSAESDGEVSFQLIRRYIFTRRSVPPSLASRLVISCLRPPVRCWPRIFLPVGLDRWPD